MVKKRFFKTNDDCEVTFECKAADAASAKLACNANGWQLIPMQRTKQGTFRTRMRLSRNREFEFRYVLDGGRWINDEAADAYRGNAYGSENGVIST